MSQKKVIQVKCEKCQETFDFEIYETLNVSTNPELKKEIISKEVFKVHCPKCGELHRINYPMIYADEEKKVLVNLVNRQSKLDDLKDLDNIKKTNYLSDYTCRLVVDMHDMVEKILIFEAGLNDRVVEVLKAIVISSASFEKNNVRACYFGGLFDDKIRVDVVMKDNTVNVAYVSMDNYYKCYDQNRAVFDENPQEWRFVNFKWALEFLAKTLDLQKN